MSAANVGELIKKLMAAMVSCVIIVLCIMNREFCMIYKLKCCNMIRASALSLVMMYVNVYCVIALFIIIIIVIIIVGIIFGAL